MPQHKECEKEMQEDWHQDHFVCVQDETLVEVQRVSLVLEQGELAEPVETGEHEAADGIEQWHGRAEHEADGHEKDDLRLHQ